MLGKDAASRLKRSIDPFFEGEDLCRHPLALHGRFSCRMGSTNQDRYAKERNSGDPCKLKCRCAQTNPSRTTFLLLKGREVYYIC